MTAAAVIRSAARITPALAAVALLGCTRQPAADNSCITVRGAAGSSLAGMSPDAELPGALPDCADAPPTAPSLPPPGGAGKFPLRSADVIVGTTGMIRVSGEEIAALTGHLSVDRLAGASREGPIALHVEDRNGDGLLGTGDVVEFYGEAGTSRYSATRTYRLFEKNAGDPAILRMADVPPPDPGLAASPALMSGAAFEQRLVYSIGIRNGSEDNFFWKLVGAPGSFSPPFDLAGIATTSTSASMITVVLQGLTQDDLANPDHHVVVDVNGVEVGEVFFDGPQEVTSSFVIPPSTLAATNVLALLLPGDTGASSDYVYLDSFRITFPRGGDPAGEDQFAVDAPGGEALDAGPYSAPGSLVALDLSDRVRPRRQEVARVTDGAGGYHARIGAFGGSGGTMQVVASPVAPDAVRPSRGALLRGNVTGADLLIVAPAEFREAADRLAARRQSQGLRVRIVEPEDAYGAFSGGELDPAAIRDLVATAVHDWTAPALKYVLLLGDGTFDYRHDLAGATPFDNGTFVPVALFDSEFAESATDTFFVDIAGDFHPELAIGRIPAASLAEADAVVDKILAYEDRPFEIGYQSRMMFVADTPSDPGDDYYFETYPETLIAGLPSYIANVDLHLSQMTSAEMQQGILDGIDSGQVWVDYFGHGSVRSWSAQQIFGTTSVPLLTNTDRPAFVVAMTCNNGLFQFPNTSATGTSQRSLAEVALLDPQGGAIGFWAETNAGYPAPLAQANESAIQRAFGGNPATLGEIELAASDAIDANGPGGADAIRGLVLFGDPSMRLRLEHAPIARVIQPAPSITGQWMDLDGSGSSDPEEQPLGYHWSVVSAPAGSLPSLGNGSQSHARFWPDREGTYSLALTVSDGLAQSAPASLSLTATGPDRAAPRSPHRWSCGIAPFESDFRGFGGGGALCLVALAFATMRVRRVGRT